MVSPHILNPKRTGMVVVVVVVVVVAVFDPPLPPVFFPKMYVLKRGF